MRQVAPDRVRGALGSINQLVICIGIVAALVVNVMVPAASWRSMFMLATVPAAALGLGAPAFYLFNLDLDKDFTPSAGAPRSCLSQSLQLRWAWWRPHEKSTIQESSGSL